MLPELTHVRFIVTSGDVIHLYACPSLGIKCDAYTGKLNQACIFVKFIIYYEVFFTLGVKMNIYLFIFITKKHYFFLIFYSYT